MLKNLATFFSWIFQPLMMPLYGAVIFVNLPYYAFLLMPDRMVYFVLICNLLFTAFLPACMILLMYRLKLINTLQLDDREDRKYPIIFTACFHFANFYLLTKIDLPAPYYLFLLAGLFSILTTLLVTWVWKISLHMTGIGALCGAMLFCGILWQIDVRILLALLFLVAGITATSRLILKAHTPGQLVAGFAAGCLPQLLLFFFL